MAVGLIVGGIVLVIGVLAVLYFLRDARDAAERRRTDPFHRGLAAGESIVSGVAEFADIFG